MSAPASDTLSTPTAALPVDRRSLAPDLARGVMLLVIALVHARILLDFNGGNSTDTPVDRLFTGLSALVADSRGYPMFAALFGYGLTRMYLRRTEAGWDWPRARKLLRRRGRWLVFFGLLHTLLLFFGDILAVYGLVALIFIPVVRWDDRKLLRLAAVWFVLGAALYSLMYVVIEAATGGAAPPGQEQTPLIDLITRVAALPLFTPFMAATTVFPFLIGIWAARRGVLDQPAQHLTLLRKVAYIGLPVAIVGGVPYALTVAKVWTDVPGGISYALSWLHTTSGYAGGLGYAALVGLAAVRIGQRPGPISRALAATGQRSMSSYLLQSVAWLVLFPAYMLGLATRLPVPGALAVGAGVWVMTVVIADLMRRAGLRGPAEVALRKLTYRRT